MSNGKAIGTDTSWVYTRDMETGWQDKEFDDKKWKKVLRADDLDYFNKLIGTAFDRWRVKPRSIWGKGSPVYFRKRINFLDFK